jgi:hypothetical protein
LTTPCAVATMLRPPVARPSPPPRMTSSHGLLFLLVLGHVSDRLCNYVCNVSNRAMQC